jgi:hypothetical protein
LKGHTDEETARFKQTFEQDVVDGFDVVSCCAGSELWQWERSGDINCAIDYADGLVTGVGLLSAGNSRVQFQNNRSSF